MFDRSEFDAALALVRRALPPTPQIAWPLLASRTGAEVWVKHENHLPTGAFKVRGGLVFMDHLRHTQPDAAGVITATRGNHGQSIAFAGARAGVPVTVVVPHGNSTEKNAAMRAYGATLIEHGADFDEAREYAAALGVAQGLVYAPSFHASLVAGVGTYSYELLTAIADLHTMYVPIGLGSGICGAILLRDMLGLRTEIVGVQSTGAPAYARSLAEGRPVSLNRADTMADGIAVRIPDPAAFRIIQAGVARIVTVTDDEIAAAVRAYWTDTHNLAEGAGAAPLAALVQERTRMQGRRVGLPLCGGNIDLDLFRRWVLPVPPTG